MAAIQTHRRSLLVTYAPAPAQHLALRYPVTTAYTNSDPAADLLGPGGVWTWRAMLRVTAYANPPGANNYVYSDENQYLFLTKGSGNPAFSCGIYLTYTGAVRVYSYSDGKTYHAQASAPGGAVPAGQWREVTVVSTGTRLLVYVDAALLLDEATPAGNWTRVATWFCGFIENARNIYAFYGELAQVLFCNVALTQAQVTAWHHRPNSYLLPQLPAGSVIAAYDFGRPISSATPGVVIADDASGNGRGMDTDGFVPDASTVVSTSPIVY